MENWATFINVEGRLVDTVVTLALGSRPRQGGYKVAGQEGARESLRMLPGVQESEGKWTLTLLKEFNLGNWSPGGLPNFQKAISRAKTPWLEEFFISLESFWSVDV
jgi:hypothetical protein